MKRSSGNRRRKARRVRPENWADLNAYANALKRFAASRDPGEFTEFLIPHEAMAEALFAVAAGADAREVFRQNAAPHRQTNLLITRTRVFVYWRERIGGATPKDAARAAQNHFSNEPSVSTQTIIRRANEYQDEALDRWERAGMDTSALRAQLAVRSKRGKWD